MDWGDFLRKACRDGHVQRVATVLKAWGADSSVVNGKHDLAFRYACAHGHVGIAQQLLALPEPARVNVNAVDDEAFCVACLRGHASIVHMLLALPDDRAVHVSARNDSAFRWACAGGHVDIVQLLLSLQGPRRINVHASFAHALVAACDMGRTSVVKLLLAQEGDRCVQGTPQCTAAFMLAFQGDHAAIVQHFVDNAHQHATVLMEIALCLVQTRGRFMATRAMGVVFWEVHAPEAMQEALPLDTCTPDDVLDVFSTEPTAQQRGADVRRALHVARLSSTKGTPDMARHVAQELDYPTAGGDTDVTALAADSTA